MTCALTWPGAVPSAVEGAAYVNRPPCSGDSTRDAKPISPIENTIIGVLPCVFKRASRRAISEGLRAVVTIL